ncbi:MAG: M15 family metallopeptidase [Spirochaetota bacterium]
MKFFAMVWVTILLLSSVKSHDQAEPASGKEGFAPVASGGTLHPRFDFTEKSFRDFAETYLEPDYRPKALRFKAEFLTLLAAVLQQERTNPALSLFVGKQHPLPQNYVPNDLVALRQYSELNLGRDSLQLRKLLIPDLLKMNAAAQADNVVLWIGSGYRSFTRQGDIFRRYAQRDGAERANRYSARAGESEHQLGLTIDFLPISQSFAHTAAGRWLSQHALEFGFSLSYPKNQEPLSGYIYEPWHYRYVGTPVVALISQYFDTFQQKFYVFWQSAAPELRRYHSESRP